MNTHEFIKDRNAKMKEEYNLLRSDKSLTQPKRVEKVAKKFNVSTSVVHDAIYRPTKYNKTANT